MTKSNNSDLSKEYLSFAPGAGDPLKKKPRKKVSKNKKKNWRKHVDISSVEDALEGERLEERTTGNLSSKQNNEIFFIDMTKDKNETLVKREKLRNKRLYIDQLLVPNPEKVKGPVPIGNKRINHKESKAKRQFKRKTAQTQKQNAINLAKSADDSDLYDLWAIDNTAVKDKIFKVKDVDKQRDFVHGKRQVKRPKHMYKKPNESKQHAAHDCPSVEVAHPGASYNPTLQDHQDLLRKANLVEEDQIKAEEKLKQSLHVPKEDLIEEGERDVEMAEGLFGSDNSDEEEAPTEEVENVVKIVNPPVRASDRKTRRKRRLEQLEKDIKTEKEEAVAEKLRENEVFRTKTFMKEIKRKEKKILERKAVRASRKKYPILSKYKYKDAELELKLSSEMKGSLRELVPEGGVALDRYKSLQKRGIIEPRVKAGKYKKVLKTRLKMKLKEKRDYQSIKL